MAGLLWLRVAVVTAVAVGAVGCCAVFLNSSYFFVSLSFLVLLCSPPAVTRLTVYRRFDILDQDEYEFV